MSNRIMVRLAFYFVILIGLAALFGSPMVFAEPVRQADAPYTLRMIGGPNSDLPRTVNAPAYSADGVEWGEMNAILNYPFGVDISGTIAVDPSIEIVTVYAYVYATDTMYPSIGRPATLGADGVYRATVMDDFSFLNMWPAWGRFDIVWQLDPADGPLINSKPVRIVYADFTQTWYELETPHVLAYWDEPAFDDPEPIAAKIAAEATAWYDFFTAAFPTPITYKPVLTIVSSHEAQYVLLGDEEFYSGFGGPWYGGVVTGLGGDLPPQLPPTCTAIDPNKRLSNEERLEAQLGYFIPYWMVSLYAPQDYPPYLTPAWWRWGQRHWVALYDDGAGYDERVRALAAQFPDELPPLQPGGEYGLLAETYLRGCADQASDIGASFINFLVINHGGLPMHQDLVALLASDMDLYAAIEQLTGESFFDLENDWRDEMGFERLSLTEVDPLSALLPVENPAFSVASVVTVAGPRPIVLLAVPNGPIGVGQCFAGTTATVLRVGRLNDVEWYEVDCGGLAGWVALDDLR